MSESIYVFADSQNLSERDRLQAIEQVFDPASQRRILETGLTKGWHCLEVGAGAGSIMRWMAEIVGESGEVVAVDLNTRFLKETQPAHVKVLETDIRDLTSELAFDLIHARYVLIHIQDFQTALSKMMALLKPGGWLVVEEPDFIAARAIVGEHSESVDRINGAIVKMYLDRGIDPALGAKLPAIFQQLELQSVTIETDVSLSNGGSGVATVMKLSARQLAEKYLATGEINQQDIEHYCSFAEDPTAWAVYYTTVGIIAQKKL